MRISGLKPGDTIELDIRGRVFRARFDSIVDGRVWFDPPPSVGHRSATARQVRRRIGSTQERLA